MNYKPNYAAQALVTGRTHTIGLIVPDLVHSFHSEVAKGLAGILRKNAYSLVISSSEENQDVETQVIDQFIARRVDALVIASTHWTAGPLRRIGEANIPCVLVDRNLPGREANFVGTDDELVGNIATEHLIAIGCRTIAHIGGTHISPARERLDGYPRTLAGHRMEPGPEHIATNDTLDELAHGVRYDSSMKLLKLTPRPDGIFCFSDAIAIGAMGAILDLGLRIPDNVALIGSANLRYDAFLRVPLSSVDQQSVAIGQRAARLAMSLVESKGKIHPKRILLEPRYVVRDSTRQS